MNIEIALLLVSPVADITRESMRNEAISAAERIDGILESAQE